MPTAHQARRERVLEAIHPGALLVFAAPVALRNNDVEHEYRQHSDFYYLTGFDEPESVLLLRSEAPHFVLFVRPRDPERETWDGPRAGVEGARSLFGADEAYPIAELDERLPDLLKGMPRLYYALGGEGDARVLAALAKLRRRERQGAEWPTALIEPAEVLHELRLRKEPEEIELMRRAIAITREAHLAVMRAARPGAHEYELEAILRRVFREAGSERPAYSPIVGSGPNATILHHRKNDRRMNDGELVLVDAGCEYGYYAADVTRTFPVSKRFDATQRAVYEVVLAAQLAAIERVRPGSTVQDVHAAALDVIVDGLIELGLVEGPRTIALEEKRYQTFFMHGTSHWLGMDVHDVGRYRRGGAPRPLEPGMVLTVEPGIYVPQSAGIDPRFAGIGVRIEDDVLVGPDGPVVLSADVPKTVEEVERACAG
ncbi:MAG: aminopeptidase P N-terminal domain-containing protein [Pseudomonadota bacterium]|nr:MAG: Xaa-Pro aminopeptidase [Pseudomonadota bacterium]